MKFARAAHLYFWVNARTQDASDSRKIKKSRRDKAVNVVPASEPLLCWSGALGVFRSEVQYSTTLRSIFQTGQRSFEYCTTICCLTRSWRRDALVHVPKPDLRARDKSEIDGSFHYNPSQYALKPFHAVAQYMFAPSFVQTKNNICAPRVSF